jgi:penicillin-binding protein 1C
MFAPLLVPYDATRFDHTAESTRIFDRDGALLREAVGAEGTRSTWVALDDTSPWVVEALLAVEDQRFWTHHGVDWIGVGRATVDSVRHRELVSGASTLTMQLARLVGDLPRSASGKLRQIVDAGRIERALDKRAILEQYLNRAPFGAGTTGVEAASLRYFGKPSASLSVAEAALLMGLPQAPSAYNPLRHPERAKRRQLHVLDRMRAVGALDDDVWAMAVAEPLVYVDAADRPSAMHFTDLVLADGPVGEVHTTLDLGVQRPVERLVADHVRALRSGGLTQAAVVVLDNDTCDVRALVGSADYWGQVGGQVNGATSLRQPGSTLKPFTYALAFERDDDPASVVADIETRYLDADGLLMHPRNFSESFSGPVLMGDALARSLNVPAVRVANKVGLDDVLTLLRDVGFTSFEADAAHYGLGLTLGNGEVTLLELAQAYAALARGGRSCTVRLREDAPVDDGRQVLSPQAAFLITDVLSDEALRAQAFGAGNPLMLRMPVAIKTGTSTNWRDSWTVGYTDRYTVAVWAGNFDGQPMDGLSGAIGAGPLFAAVTKHLVGRGSVAAPPRRPEPPDGVVPVQVCAWSGASPGPSCAAQRTVFVPEAHADRATCAWHKSIAIDARNGKRASERCPSAHVVHRTFEVLPPAYREWQAGHPSSAPPAEWSPLCPPDGVTVDALVVVHPNPDDVFLIEPGYDRATQTLELSVEVDPPVPEVTWIVDGASIGTAAWPYEASWPLARGQHRVEVVAGDRRSEPVAFEVR